MVRSTYEKVAEWNTRCNKAPVELGSEEYWQALGSQVERIQEELDETREAIVNRDFKEVLDGGCDLDVTVSGLNFLNGMEYSKAIKRVLDNNDTKYSDDIYVAQSAADLYTSRGMDCEVQSVVDGEEVYHSVHRCKDNKIMKLIGHPRVILDDLVPKEV